MEANLEELKLTITTAFTFVIVHCLHKPKQHPRADISCLHLLHNLVLPLTSSLAIPSVPPFILIDNLHNCGILRPIQPASLWVTTNQKPTTNMSLARSLRGSCACNRNQYLIKAPQDARDVAQVHFGTDASHRKSDPRGHPQPYYADHPADASPQALPKPVSSRRTFASP